MQLTQNQKNALAEFKNFVSKRNKISLYLSLVVLICYYVFVLSVGLIPDILAYKIGSSAVSLGILAGLGIIFLCIISTGIYVLIANSFFDSENSRLLKELEKEELISPLKEGKVDYRELR